MKSKCADKTFRMHVRNRKLCIFAHVRRQHSLGTAHKISHICKNRHMKQEELQQRILEMVSRRNKCWVGFSRAEPSQTLSPEAASNINKVQTCIHRHENGNKSGIGERQIRRKYSTRNNNKKITLDEFCK